ncbi:MAG: methylhydantoinase [Actinomycetota bacterium]|nr:methylhydantoinase [Actinomycetota bacterium]
MDVRVGVDVGGTFTKAVACESSGPVVARAVVPTTHQAVAGVAEGVVRSLRALREQLRDRGRDRIALVAHSSTQAVNALLEGDTSNVGVVGIGRRPDLRRARRRTQLGEIRLAPSRRLRTIHRFVDATSGLTHDVLRDAVRSLVNEGVESLCFSEAFGVDDARGEWMGLEVAEEQGIPACAGHELSGLYGLEMRTLTAAINATILPAALRTARHVQEGIEELDHLPLLVMRGDGGAADLSAMSRHPIFSAFSGPAASVSGALRHLSVHDGVVVEVGGTSTNVSAIRAGRPVLSYVRVLDHVTSVRSLDVRVAGVAGGSLVRAQRRLGRVEIDVGPRSAHIAGLRYCSFAREQELAGGRVVWLAPRPGDTDDYLVVENRDGERFAITPTCAANALREVPDGAYAWGDADSSRIALELAGRELGFEWRGLAFRILQRAAEKIAACIVDTVREHGLRHPTIVGVGGGAGALVPALARGLDLEWAIPRDAEIISSIGDALSLIRVEIERSLTRASSSEVADAHRAAEEAALRAGAAPDSVHTESSAVPERRALRVVAYGATRLAADAPGPDLAEQELLAAAARELGSSVRLVASAPPYFVFVDDDERRCAVVDRSGSVIYSGDAEIATGTGAQVSALLSQKVPQLIRHYGPVAVAPAIRIVRGNRLIDLTLLSAPERALEAALAECSVNESDAVVALLSRD